MSKDMALVIRFVGSVLILTVLSLAGLAAMDRTSDILEILAGSSLTGLVGLLARPNTNTETEG